MAQRKVSVLDPAKEDRRRWEAKRADKVIGVLHAEVLFCEFCPNAIPPSQLLIDIGGRRACTECARRDVAP